MRVFDAAKESVARCAVLTYEMEKQFLTLTGSATQRVEMESPEFLATGDLFWFDQLAALGEFEGPGFMQSNDAMVVQGEELKHFRITWSEGVSLAFDSAGDAEERGALKSAKFRGDVKVRTDELRLSSLLMNVEFSPKTESVSSIGVSSSGQWHWYRSIVSTCKRRRLSSTARWICGRLSPSPSGPSHMRVRTFVATIRRPRLRRAFIQRPMISSDTPPGLPGAHWLYMSALSRKLPPASTNASMTANDALSSAVQPNCIVPRQRADTWRSVAPSLRGLKA